MFYFYKLKKDISKIVFLDYGYSKIDRDSMLVSRLKVREECPCYDISGYVYLRYEHFDLATKEEVDAFLAKQAKYTIEEYVNMKSTRVGLGTTGTTINGVHIVRNNIPCHANFVGCEGITAAATYTNHNRKYVTDENMDAFKELIHWIMNKSPWLHCIARSWDILSATERTDRAMNGAVPIDIEAPANEVASFCVAMRVVTEHEWTLNTYKELRSMGISIPLSFLLSGHIIHEEGGGFRYFRNTSWHHFMEYSQNISHLCKFFKEGFFFKGRSDAPFKKGRYYYIANQITSDNTNSVEELANKCLITEGKGFDTRTVFDYTKFINTFKKEWKNA
jgi:hypothetical protein